MNGEQRQLLRQAVSDRRRALYEEAHGRARRHGYSRKDDPTDRELQVIRLLADGWSQPTIATHLHLAKGTVKCHVSHVIGKLGALNATHACVIAVRLGWIE